MCSKIVSWQKGRKNFEMEEKTNRIVWLIRSFRALLFTLIAEQFSDGIYPLIIFKIRTMLLYFYLGVTISIKKAIT